MQARDRFARRVFTIAAIYGMLVLLPQYLVETGYGPALPAPLRRPEHFYGFIGVALAWQVVFLVIAGDVRRYRPLMLAAMLEKLAFGVPVLVLYGRGRVAPDVLAAGLIDLALGALFVLAFRATRDATA
jgi:hypothetical protein